MTSCLETDKLKEEDNYNVFLRLERVCNYRGIKVMFEPMNSNYFLYHEERKHIILCPSVEKRHLELLIKFIRA